VAYDAAGRLNRVYYQGGSTVDYANIAQWNAAWQLTSTTRTTAVTVDDTT
jgi:hypothetical protein